MTQTQHIQMYMCAHVLRLLYLVYGGRILTCISLCFCDVRAYVRVCVSVSVSVSVCLCDCVRACVRACASVHVRACSYDLTCTQNHDHAHSFVYVTTHVLYT